MDDAPALVSIEQACRIVAEHVPLTGVEEVGLDAALGRTLAADVACDVDVPPFDKAMMDGYAVRAADVYEIPARLQLCGQIAAGAVPTTGVGAGQAMQINTGAPMPSGADAVVPVEETEACSDTVVLIKARKAAGKHVGLQGQYVRRGDVVLTAGTRVAAAHVAIAATAGAARLRVHARPRVGILVTGDELVDVGVKPTGAQIRNSNGPTLEALMREVGIEPQWIDVVGDDKAELECKIRRGLELDCLCITGGVSMGAFDFVPEILGRCGVKVHFRKMTIKPGKPTLFGTAPSGAAVFALPGNPVGVFVVCLLLVRPALERMQGAKDVFPKSCAATLEGDVKSSKQRRSYWPARVTPDADGNLNARVLPWSGSGDPFGMSEANGLIVLEADAATARTGDRATVIVIGVL